MAYIPHRRRCLRRRAQHFQMAYIAGGSPRTSAAAAMIASTVISIMLDSLGWWYAAVAEACWVVLTIVGTFHMKRIIV